MFKVHFCLCLDSSDTVWEFVTDKLGAKGAVLAGGRYDGLVPLLGGPPAASVCF